MKNIQKEPQPVDLACELDNLMIEIPEGPFIYGISDEEKLTAAEKSAVHPDRLYFHSKKENLSAKKFWIDKYPVTRGQFLRFMKETGYKFSRNGWTIGWSEIVNTADLKDNKKLFCPMIGANYEDAVAYAQWLGKRLPTEIEWEKAARGVDGQLFPWGDKWENMVPAQGDLTLDSTFIVGSRPQLASPYGVCDMKGGVLEWVKTAYPAVSKDGSNTASDSHILAGSSIFHRSICSHMVTSRFSWHESMRMYNTGFRCVSDNPPDSKNPEFCYNPPEINHLKYSKINKDLYLKQPIELLPMDCSTFHIKTPWFPDSIWSVDVPEGKWGPFMGQNPGIWPDETRKELWKTDWTRSESTNSIQYERSQGDQSLKVEVKAEDDLVRCIITPHNLGAIDLSTVCIKTFSPFFSSQEQLTQYRVDEDTLISAAKLPADLQETKQLHWTVGNNLPYGAMVFKSYDASSFIAVIAPKGCSAVGNGVFPCVHFKGEVMLTEKQTEIKILFFIGTEAKLIQRVKTLANQDQDG